MCKLCISDGYIYKYVTRTRALAIGIPTKSIQMTSWHTEAAIDRKSVDLLISQTPEKNFSIGLHARATQIDD